VLRLTAIDHVGLTAADLDRTVAFYQQLGLTLLRMSGPNADGTRSAVIQVGAQELNIFSRPGLGSRAGSGDAGGIDHFGFAVEARSIDEVIADLRAAGIPIARGPIERRDATALFVRDPDGVRVELQLKRPTDAAPEPGTPPAR
jgi:catechol 2,3-dioxygenase-like lactoylglutathione lyase family enzyme